MTVVRSIRIACLSLVAVVCVPCAVHASEAAPPLHERSRPMSDIEANDIVLYGIVLSTNRRQSVALLGTRGGQALPYRPGEEIASAWRLQTVDRTTAIVSDAAGSRYRLALVPEDGRGASQAAARLPPIQRLQAPVPGEMPSDEMLMQANREFNLPARD